MRSKYRHIGVVVFFITVWCLWAAVPAHAETWRFLHTKYLKLRFKSDRDLIEFNRKIEFGGESGGFFSFRSQNKQGKDLNDEIIRKVDRLVEKVQIILDMRKPFRKVNVNLYPDAGALHQAYFKLYRARKQPRAWYTFERNTIYMNVQDVFAGMLAHEVAHAVVDHYLTVRPPRATAEILARYVDQHLNEKAKVY